MKGKGQRAKMQDQNRDPHCTQQKFGRRRGGNCEYRSQMRIPSTRPLMSLITTLFQEFAQVANRAVQSLSVKANSSVLPGDTSQKSAKILPDFELRQKGANQLIEENNQLPTNYEKTQPTTNKQE